MTSFPLLFCNVLCSLSHYLVYFCCSRLCFAFYYLSMSLYSLYSFFFQGSFRPSVPSRERIQVRVCVCVCVHFHVLMGSKLERADLAAAPKPTENLFFCHMNLHVQEHAHEMDKCSHHSPAYVCIYISVQHISFSPTHFRSDGVIGLMRG